MWTVLDNAMGAQADLLATSLTYQIVPRSVDLPTQQNTTLQPQGPCTGGVVSQVGSANLNWIVTFYSEYLFLVSVQKLHSLFSFVWCIR